MLDLDLGAGAAAPLWTVLSPRRALAMQEEGRPAKSQESSWIWCGCYPGLLSCGPTNSFSAEVVCTGLSDTCLRKVSSFLLPDNILIFTRR